MAPPSPRTGAAPCGASYRKRLPRSPRPVAHRKHRWLEVYRADFSKPYREDPAPRRDWLPRDCFLTTTSLIATRGCHNRCGFCYLSTDDLSLVREMALAGCTGVFIGFESLADGNLKTTRKRTPRTADYARRVAILHNNGIQINGSFVLGFDDDDPEVFQKTVAWIEQNRLECATFHILTPYPGTPFFRQMEAEGRLLHKDWDLYDTAHVVFRPKRMTPDELMEGYSWCYRTLFSSRSIWRRRPRDWASAPSYLAMSTDIP